MELPANLFTALPDDLTAEAIELLCADAGARVERIVSRGHASPEGFWYDQGWVEFVLLLSGQARLRFADPDGLVTLDPGDWLVIAAHRRHRVEWTATDAETIWLAVHLPERTERDASDRPAALV